MTALGKLILLLVIDLKNLSFLFSLLSSAEIGVKTILEYQLGPYMIPTLLHHLF
jgi:hypothetical protein